MAAGFVALAVALPAVPALASPGYLQSLVVNLAVPLLLCAPLLWVARRGLQGGAHPGWVVALGAALGGLPAALTAVVAAAGDGTLCAPGPAWEHTLAGPVASGALVAAMMTVVAAFTRPGWRAALVVLGLLAGSALISGVRALTAPQVFVINPLFGHLRGPLYDQGMPPMGRVWSMRVETVVWVAAMLALAGAGQARLHGRARFPARMALGAVCVGVGLAAHVALAPVWMPGRTALAAALSQQVAGRQVVLHAVPFSVGPAMLKRLVWEADRHVEELRALLGLAEDGPRVHVWLYPDAERKLELLGASTTLLARPWDHEIHVQGTALPVGALRHELAHVVLGELQHNPLRVPTVWGVVPNVLLVEGAATALQEEWGPLTLQQRAALLRRMGHMPALAALATPWGFLLESGPRAYTTAGAFLQYVVQSQGGAQLVAAYQNGSLEGLQDLGAMERAWHGALDALEVPAQATGSAQRAFQVQGIAQGVCSDDKPGLWSAARAAANQGDLDRAEELFRVLAALDPASPEPLLALMAGAAAQGDRRRVFGLAAEMMALEPPAEVRSRVRLAQAQAQARTGAWDEAAEALALAAPDVQEPARARALTVLTPAVGAVLEGPERGCARGGLAVLQFLWGRGPERAHGRSDLLALDAGAAAVPKDRGACAGRAPALRAVLAYLTGRQLVTEDPGRASRALLEALRLGLPSDLLTREALLLTAEAAEGLHAFSRAAELYAAAEVASRTEGQRQVPRALEKRARYAARRMIEDAR